MFESFRRRITRGYVLLAVTLVVVVVAASTALAFLLYARGMNEAISGATQRVTQAARAITPSRPLAQAAPQIVTSVGRSRFHVLVLDDRGRPLAQNEREGPPSAGRAIVIAIGRAIGLPRASVSVPGGTVLISADFDRFGDVLIWYWSIMLPIGILLVVAAWLTARRITSSAIGPLAEVTRALRVIAEGDFTPQRLLNQSSELQELTAAYNDVALSLANATAERLQTENQMRQFIADAGHELRTPLTIVMGYLDVLRQGIVQGPDATRQTYETMFDESRRMRALIEKLIFLARLDRAQAPVRLERVDLVQLTQQVTASLQQLSGGRICAEVPQNVAEVLADESELYEAVRNVVENAIKYAPDSPIELSVIARDGRACVAVADRGPGMDPEEKRHAFDRFYRGSARSSVEGSGLGLAIAKRAAERAGGTISLESDPGRGVKVEICLPLSS